MILKVKSLLIVLTNWFLTSVNILQNDFKSLKAIVVGLLFVLININVVNAAIITVTGNSNWSAGNLPTGAPVGPFVRARTHKLSLWSAATSKSACHPIANG